MEMTQDQKVAFAKNYYAEMKVGIKRMRDTAEATPPGELRDKRLKMVAECEATRIWFRDKWGIF